MRISDWSSDVCSSDLIFNYWIKGDEIPNSQFRSKRSRASPVQRQRSSLRSLRSIARSTWKVNLFRTYRTFACPILSTWLSSRRLASCTMERCRSMRSEEHTSELQSLMRISYAVFCLKKKQKYRRNHDHNTNT